MVDYIYHKSKGTLTGYDQVWTVRSGIPGRYQPTPNGLYSIPKGALMAGAPGYGVPYDKKYSTAPYSYKDKKGFSWFLWLGLNNLGIHPDGNVPGTQGCIGIIEDDTRPLFNQLKALSGTIITVQVEP